MAYFYYDMSMWHTGSPGVLCTTRTAALLVAYALSEFVWHPLVAADSRSGMRLDFRRVGAGLLLQCCAVVLFVGSGPGNWSLFVTAFLLSAFGLVRALLDNCRVTQEKPGRRVFSFLFSHAAHISLLIVLGEVMLGRQDSEGWGHKLAMYAAKWIPSCGENPENRRLWAEHTEHQLCAAAIVTAVLIVSIVGGRFFVARVLETRIGDVGQKAKSSPAIGMYERLLYTVLLCYGQWEAVGFVLTAKSIARFKELDDQKFAEFYLLGTLASVTWALGCALALRWILQL